MPVSGLPPLLPSSDTSMAGMMSGAGSFAAAGAAYPAFTGGTNPPAPSGPRHNLRIVQQLVSSLYMRRFGLQSPSQATRASDPAPRSHSSLSPPASRLAAPAAPCSTPTDTVPHRLDALKGAGLHRHSADGNKPDSRTLLLAPVSSLPAAVSVTSLVEAGRKASALPAMEKARSQDETDRRLPAASRSAIGPADTSDSDDDLPLPTRDDDETTRDMISARSSNFEDVFLLAKRSERS